MTDPVDAKTPAPVPDPSTALAMLQHDSAAVALCDAQGRVEWCNATLLEARAQTMDGAHGQSLARWLGLSPADASVLETALAETGPKVLPDMAWMAHGAARRWWRAQLHSLPDGRRLVRWLCTDELHQQAGEIARLADLLELAQDFGRLGVWERDARTLQGRWDRHVHRLWGMPEDSLGPSFGEAAQSIVDEDRAALESAFRQSLRQSGSYAHRYRVRLPDGQVRHLRSHWAVRDGDDGLPERVLGILVDDTEAFDLARSHTETLEQLGLALELGNIVLWRHDLPADLLHFSERAFEVLGLDQPITALTPEQLREYVHPDDHDALRHAMERALAGAQPVDVETRFRHADGSWRHLLTRRVLQRDAQGKPLALLGVGLDISERVKATKRQTELMRQFELTARTAGIGYWSVEADTGRARWSAQTFELHGLPPDAPALPMRQWLERFVHPADRDTVQRAFGDWVRRGVPNLELEFRILRCDGGKRQVLSYSRLEGACGHYDFFGVLVDVTERRAAEAALHQASQRAALATRGAGMGTWEQDLITGESLWDEQMWRLRGLEPQAQAPSVDERMALVHPDDREVTLRKLNEATTAGTLSNLEFRVRWPDGQTRWIASRATGVLDEQGRLTRRIGVNWDVTDMRMAQAAREERALAQRESQAKSQFLSRMSHELRTPLNAVLGFAQLLLSDGEKVTAETRRRRLEQIHGAGKHLLSLIDDVLDLSSLEGGELRLTTTAVPLAPLVTGTLPLVERLARQRKVRLRSGPLVGVARADATRLRQVLLNLLTNALKYNQEGGQVLVEAESHGEQVLLRVSDTGRGMDDAQLQQAFEPFNRLGRENDGIEGTGIGLSIVRALVERMGGTVQVRSAPGEGSVFEVWLRDGERLQAMPGLGAVSGAAVSDAAEAMPPMPAAAGHGRPARLLYIEDNPVNLLIVQELLGARPNLLLDTAVDGLGGVRQAVQGHPDLILVDMQLPDIDGHEVLRRLRAEAATAAIPCVAVSANALPEDIQRARDAGFADYWTKPLDLQRFLQSIDAMLGAAEAASG